MCAAQEVAILLSLSPTLSNPEYLIGQNKHFEATQYHAEFLRVLYSKYNCYKKNKN